VSLTLFVYDQDRTLAASFWIISTGSMASIVVPLIVSGVPTAFRKWHSRRCGEVTRANHPSGTRRGGVVVQASVLPEGVEHLQRRAPVCAGITCAAASRIAQERRLRAVEVLDHLGCAVNLRAVRQSGRVVAPAWRLQGRPVVLILGESVLRGGSGQRDVGPTNCPLVDSGVARARVVGGIPAAQAPSGPTSWPSSPGWWQRAVSLSHTPGKPPRRITPRSLHGGAGARRPPGFGRERGSVAPKQCH